jgi:hypothetical protein
VISIAEAKEIAEHNMRCRMRQLEAGGEPECPEAYVLWARGIDGDLPCRCPPQPLITSQPAPTAPATAPGLLFLQSISQILLASSRTEAIHGFAMRNTETQPTKTKAGVTRDQLIAWATRNGWKLDRWGHLKKDFPNGTHRLKLSRIAARHEHHTPFGWAVLASGYYKQLTITADDKLAGLNR